MEKIAPEIRQKIIEMRLDGATWKEIEEKLNLTKDAGGSIYNKKWFLEGIRGGKEERRQKEKEKKKEVNKEEVPEVKKPEIKTVDEEIEKHIRMSDKMPPDIKKEKKVQPGKTNDTKEKKEEKKEKSSFGLWAILIIALIIGVVVIFFLLKGKKAEVKEPEEEKPKTVGFEGRTEEDL